MTTDPATASDLAMRIPTNAETRAAVDAGAYDSCDAIDNVAADRLQQALFGAHGSPTRFATDLELLAEKR